MTEATTAGDDKIRCDACPVMCYIKPGAAGACDRYANHNGELVRVDPHIVLERTVSHGGRLVPFQAGGDWDGKIVHEPNVFVTAIGAGTTYPDYKPAPFIVSSEIDGVDMVTVVTEGIFSYCGVKVKIDTDRHLGPETATVRAQGEAIGHVTTGEYGSQMLSLGGVHHLTGGSKKEGRVTFDALMDLSNCKPVELTIDGGATVVVQAGYPPIVNGVAEERMRVGCGSATIGMFAKQWHGKVDEVVVVDDHITGVLSEHQAGKLLDIPDTGIKMKGRRSTPGRYFQVAEPGTGWGGTKISDPLSVLGPFDPKTARPGTTMLMVSTTGEYGSQMLSLGGVHHLTGGSKKEGRVTCDALMDLSNCKPVELTIDGGATVVVQAGYPPIVNGVAEERMRVGCGSATIGMFAKQWHGKVDEVVVVDDHITGVLSEHQAGKLLDIPDTGIKMKGRRSTPGRYFQVAEPGTGWGGTKISDPLSVLGPFDPKTARPGTTMLMVSTTGEHAAYYELDAALKPVEKPMPTALKLSVERIQENCEPALCTVLFMGGAGGSLRAGVTDNPVRLTRSVKDALTRVTSGGAPVYVWPGGGITFMVDVTRLPAGAFGYVPTPALVAPIEFTLKLSDYAALGGHMDYVRPLSSLKDNTEIRQVPQSSPGQRA